MNRELLYAGSLPTSLYANQSQQFGMISDGFLIEAVMGQSPWCYGLACAPTAPPSMSLTIGRGEIGQMAVVDATNPGSSAIANTTAALMKVGLNLAATTLTFVAPATSGQSQVFLIEGQMQESDTGATVLQYFNPAAPNVPFSGPGNSGASNTTIRQQVVVLQVVAGAPAATGSQVAPGVTSGWVPLYLVTIANGATTLTTANFVVHPAAPFVSFNLPALTPGFSRMAVFTSSQTWTVPTGVNLVKVRLCGGGGGGGACSGALGSGAGGGAGGFVEGNYSVTPGNTFSVTVGAPGSAGGAVSGVLDGGPGGTTSFGALASATGGVGGVGSTGTVTSSAGGDGGTGSGGSVNLRGGAGSDGQSGSVLVAGNGGASAFGGGGRAATSAFGAIQNGHAPGSGGGACYNVSAGGGTGASGIVIVEY